MQITIRSLGGKLIIAATLTFLLCMLLFTILSWAILRFYAEYQAEKDAQTHLSLVRLAYQNHQHTIRDDLERVIRNRDITQALSQPVTVQASNQYLRRLLVAFSASDHFSTLDLVSANHTIIAHGEVAGSRSPFSSAEGELIDQTLRGQSVSL